MIEPIYRREFVVDDLVSDCFGRLKISSILYYVQEMAGSHYDRIALDTPQPGRKLLWVITRHRVQITRLPAKGERIRLETWPMPTTRVAYPRSVIAYDDRGGELFRSVSLWALIDPQTRAMVLPGKSGVLVPGILRGNELPSPRSLAPAACGAAARRRVCFSDLDTNGHMNNCRYLEWAMDVLPASFHREHLLTDVTLCYPAEAREGEELEISWALTPDGVLHADIGRLEKDKKVRVFAADLHYER